MPIADVGLICLAIHAYRKAASEAKSSPYESMKYTEVILDQSCTMKLSR